MAHVTSLTFWDASYISSQSTFDHYIYNPAIGAYLLHDRIDYCIGTPYIEQLKSIKDTGDLISKIKVPLKIITADHNGNKDAGMKLFQRANEPKEFVTIVGANHCFDTFDAEDRLLEETVMWLNKQ